jgi:hypothetical protein
MVKIRDLAMIVQNWLEIHIQKNYSMSLKRKLKINLSAKSLEPFSQPRINFLGILWMIVKTKGSVKSLLKLLPEEIISRTSVITFVICNSEFWIWKSWQIWLYKFILTKIIIWWITCKRTWKPKTLFKNNNSAATTAVRSDKASTRG